MTEQKKLSRREIAEQALKHPNMVRALNVLSYAEGTEKHGYHTNFGGSRLQDLSWHPNKILGRTKDGATTATGRYQFLGSTWEEQAKKLGLTDFGPHNQDLAAVGLIMEQGALNDILNGDITKAAYKLRHIWASLPDNPSKNQPHKTHAQIIDAWNRNGGRIDPASFVHPSQKLYPMNGQQYDYSTTQPKPIAQQQYIPQPTNIGDQLATTFQGSKPKQDNSFADYFNQINSTLDPLQQLEPVAPKQSNRVKYQEQLAQAFGIEPQVNNGLGDYVSELVKSIYDQA